ncbi:MAG: 16S rRNA (cytosine(1402)-N(4))-methyltransferase RsmH [bacterium]|nr:16S rRNA (cytosine(1402)-N(4))-methyltransferase RsmH [bacterium]MXX64193.1 16S rRNA (cytosine(1402)-N(4))-methyltransferase RsmH [Acidimicrobiia bacterium]MCY3579034.1 16S rRNA (cytosine(1402)-N(4))-methyltransferase RsmH [bacterium]MCY3652644.1 16S rRNA (cytosine(1402)-N(4))-methyltransferase RsmH [bacterium]MDE0643001.1 16S rRNA (cytosine(1402)-N(4))-methyltransferase RsmH [bacterium]
MGQESKKFQSRSGRPFHTPVMREQVVSYFSSIKEGVIVDATFGGGGHTAALLDHLDLAVQVLGIDRDPAAIRRAPDRDRLRLVEDNFCRLDRILDDQGLDWIAGILFDLGVSSHQLDESGRGFSFRREGPLDMRMGSDTDRTAYQIVNDTQPDELAQILSSFGEERFARRIARSIVANRPIKTTVRLAEIVTEAIPAATRRKGRHPARRTFQAIRLAVNEELSALSDGLEAGLRFLRTGGICVAISYHSLEDRIVKRRFRLGEGRAPGPVLPEPPPVELENLLRKVKRPDADEVQQNPRARSARLRAVKKVK